ncbi:MAG: hypothetical protein IIZ83_08370 [Oscillospiraceae bacterium]|nr:hypothetical protein [Oscillospiraceae bacterium]
MAETIAQAYVQILPSTEGIKGQLTELLGGEAESAGGKAGNAWSKAFGVGAAAVGALATGVTALGSELLSQTGELAAYGDNIDKMSQKMGLSATAYQEWSAIMQHSGASIDSMQRGMTTLSSAVESGSEAFAAIGISLEDAAAMSQEDLFAAVITGLQGMEEGTERTVLAQQLLGGSSRELGALLNTSAEETEAMRQRVHELGGVMSDEAVKAAAAYQDTLQDMQTSLGGLKRNMISDFLPGVTEAMSGLTDIFTGNSDEGLGKISSGIDSVAKTLTEKAPQFLQVGAKIIEALGQAIISNAPQLISAASQVILTLTTDLIQSLPELISVGFDIILTLADALIQALPELIPALVDVILTIVEKLTEPDTLMMLVDVAFQLIGAVAMGLIEAIPKLIEKVPEIIKNLVEAIIRYGGQLVESGKTLISKLGEGVRDAAGKAVEAFGRVWDSIKETVGGWIDKALQWGRDLIQKFVDGILERWERFKGRLQGIGDWLGDTFGVKNNEMGSVSELIQSSPLISNAIPDSLNRSELQIQRQLTSTLALSDELRQMTPTPAGTLPAGQASGTGAQSGHKQIVVILQLDKATLGRAVYQLNDEETQRVGVKLALTGGAA